LREGLGTLTDEMRGLIEIERSLDPKFCIETSNPFNLPPNVPSGWRRMMMNWRVMPRAFMIFVNMSMGLSMGLAMFMLLRFFVLMLFM